MRVLSITFCDFFFSFIAFRDNIEAKGGVFMAELKDILKKLRSEKNMSQAVLAQELGAGLSTVASWEVGKRYPSRENMEQLSDLFNVDIPKSIHDCPSDILNPKDTWKDKNAYDEAANKLAQMFADNFAAKYPNMPSEIVNAGPRVK